MLEVSKRHVEPRSCCLEIEQARQIAVKMRPSDAKDVFLVIRSSGMRPAEAYAMKWEYMNFGKRIYHNPDGKTKSARRKMPLVDLGLGEPLAILKRTGDAQGWIFPSALAPSGHIESIGKTFNAARDKAGVPKTLILYSSRHGALTDLSEVLTTREVMDIGGHTDMHVAARYQHLNVERIQDKIVTLKKVL